MLLIESAAMLTGEVLDMYRFVSELLNPYPLLLVAAIAALCFVWRRQIALRRQITLVAVPVLTLTIISLPVTCYLAQGTLEWQVSASAIDPAETEPIVVLAGALFPDVGTGTGAVLAPDSIYRCQYAADLYHRGAPCLVIVSGGKVNPSVDAPPLGRLMRDYLIALRVSPEHILVEDQSTTTYENAARCRVLLAAREIRRIRLVTDAVSMPRALRCFVAQEFDVQPKACCYWTVDFRLKPSSVWPSTDACSGVALVVHEWLGLAWYKLTRRI